MSKAAETRAFIIERTASLFNRQGYAGTSMSDITAATGLTKGSVYGNFSNKDEVALAVFDYNLKRITDVIANAVNDARSAREQLLAYVRVYTDFSKFPFMEGGCPILNTATEADDTHPGLREKAREAILRWKDRLIKIIERGIAAKEFRADIAPEKTALTIIATVEGAIMISKLTGDTKYRKAIMQSVEELIRGLG